MGDAYDPEDLRLALARAPAGRDRREYPPQRGPRALPRGDGCVARPGRLRDWEEERLAWVEANDACRRDILARLDADGPLTSRDLPDTCVAPWRSSGWNDHRNVPRMLDMMAARGEVAVAGRRGRDRLWDLADRVYPHDDVVPLEDAVHLRHERLLGALGIARSREVGGAGEPAVVDGVRGCLAGRPDAARRRLRGPHGAAVTPGPAGLRPQAHGRAVPVRLPAGDVQAGTPSGAGATGRCPSCTGIGWSARWTRPPTARPESSGSTPCTRTSPSPRRWRRRSAARSRASRGGSASSSATAEDRKGACSSSSRADDQPPARHDDPAERHVRAGEPAPAARRRAGAPRQRRGRRPRCRDAGQPRARPGHQPAPVPAPGPVRPHTRPARAPRRGPRERPAPCRVPPRPRRPAAVARRPGDRT